MDAFKKRGKNEKGAKNLKQKLQGNQIQTNLHTHVMQQWLVALNMTVSSTVGRPEF